MTKPTREMLQAIVRAYYRLKPENVCGGSLHIVLDDGNYDDHSVEFCRKYAAEQGDTDGVWLASVLQTLNVQERIELLDWPSAQLESLEEHGIQVTQEYVQERRAYWVAQLESGLFEDERHQFKEAIKACDDWLSTSPEVRQLASLLADALVQR